MTLRSTPPTNNTATGNAEFMVAAASSYLNLPSFWLEQPHTWFNMCESAFATGNIVIVILGKSTNRRYLNLKVDSIDKKFRRSTEELAPGYGDLV